MVKLIEATGPFTKLSVPIIRRTEKYTVFGKEMQSRPPIHQEIRSSKRMKC